jgi:hypothetical protein
MSEWAERMNPAEDPRRTQARRYAWALGGLVIFFYVGVLAWYVFGGRFGG